jgi:hypothetical protein
MTRTPPRFLNVDLDLESRGPLDLLADALPSLTVMASFRVRRKYVLCLEGAWLSITPDQTLRRLTRAVASLSGEPRRLWKRASKRCFNIGFDCGDVRLPPFHIQSTTIEAVSKLGASVEITLYPAATPRTRKR